ncbi:hypothetical protein ACOMHN_042857 [Nucella lapillus]
MLPPTLCISTFPPLWFALTWPLGDTDSDGRSPVTLNGREIDGYIQTFNKNRLTEIQARADPAEAGVGFPAPSLPLSPPTTGSEDRV